MFQILLFVVPTCNPISKSRRVIYKRIGSTSSKSIRSRNGHHCATVSGLRRWTRIQTAATDE